MASKSPEMKIKQKQIVNQAISNRDICILIYELAEKFGGLKKIAEKAGINYWTLWNQLNRNKGGVLAETILKIVIGTGNPFLLEEMCASCGYTVISMSEGLSPQKTIENLIKHSVIHLGQSTDENEKAHDSNSPGGKKITKPEGIKVIRKIHKTIRDLRTWEIKIIREMR